MNQSERTVCHCTDEGFAFVAHPEGLDMHYSLCYAMLCPEPIPRLEILSTDNLSRPM